MKKPKKGELLANPNYLKTWNTFQRDHTTDGPILLPLSISIEDGVIARNRISAGDLAVLKRSLLSEFKQHCDGLDKSVRDCYSRATFKKMLDEYLIAFDGDNSQTEPPKSPLDLSIIRPAWILFYLPRENWSFSKHRQYSMENDNDDVTRNCEKICTLADNRILLLANHCRSAPKGLKYNLHVTIKQKVGRKTMATDIIIDPGMDNSDRPGGD